MRNRPSFIDFYKSHFRKTKVVENYKTRKRYIEKNEYKNRILLFTILLIVLVIWFLISLYRVKTGNNDNLRMNVSSILVIIISIVIYPLRYFIVDFEETEKYDKYDTVKENILQFIIYFIILIFACLSEYINAVYMYVY